MERGLPLRGANHDIRTGREQLQLDGPQTEFGRHVQRRPALGIACVEMAALRQERSDLQQIFSLDGLVKLELGGRAPTLGAGEYGHSNSRDEADSERARRVESEHGRQSPGNR
jgi:hypothetical protein